MWTPVSVRIGECSKGGIRVEILKKLKFQNVPKLHQMTRNDEISVCNDIRWSLGVIAVRLTLGDPLSGPAAPRPVPSGGAAMPFPSGG